jgi:hypothetical protein
LVLSFAAGALLMTGLGGALGVFDRGPSEQDVSEAAQRGREEAIAEVEARMADGVEIRAEEGFQQGREAVEWLTLDRLPNPDGWFAGVRTGRQQLERLGEEAFQSGYEAGQLEGREQALGVYRWEPEEPTSISPMSEP